MDDSGHRGASLIEAPTGTGGAGAPAVVTGLLNYIDHTAERVLTNLADPSKSYMPLEPHAVPIHNARLHPTSLDKEGFALYRHESEIAKGSEILEVNRVFHLEPPPINLAYQDEALPLVREIAQARQIAPVVSGLTVRHSLKHWDKTWQPAAAIVHIDLATSSFEAFVRHAFAGAGIELKPYRRAILFQIWRAISPGPQDSMLALCDGRTATAADMTPMDMIFSEGDTTNEKFDSRVVKYNPDHKWYCYPDLSPDEMIVFKGYDTDS
jgi:hypothetical protein